MNDTSPPQPPNWRPLDAVQRRVLGVLIEKAKTTPAGYPMSVNAIVTACNQKSNRKPLMSLDDYDVQNTLNDLMSLGVVTEVDWMGRVPKYRHQAYDWLGVDKAELAVLAELLLRGEQTLGDLRARAARMEPIADQAALRPIVDHLVQRGLMLELTPAGRGQIVTHNLYTDTERAELTRPATARPMPAAPSAPPPASPAAVPSPSPDALQRLTAEVAELRAEVQALRSEVQRLREGR